MASFQKSLAQAIRDRRSTPSFDGEPIPPRDLWQILDAGLHAPSGYNMQPWRFIVVRGAARERLGQVWADALKARVARAQARESKVNARLSKAEATCGTATT